MSLVSISAIEERYWDKGSYKKQVKDLDFLSKGDFYRQKAVSKCKLFKDGCFVNLVSNYGDIWIEVVSTWDDSNLFQVVKGYDERNTIYSKSKIRYVADKIKDLKHPRNPRIVYTRKGVFGGKNGMPIEDFFKDEDFA